MSTPSNKAKALFDQAVELTSPAERAAYLDRACGGDAELRGRVEELLRAYVDAGSFLERPPAGLAGTVESGSAGNEITQTAGPAPEAIVSGRYKLLEQIGEGGMGTVWMAQQQEPVKRPVALKLIKPGMDSKQVLARFEAERQALALMDHPNIAKVHDAGVTADGRPFFVMELVKGVPITDYCDQHHLTPRQRLELFVPVCHAVQHAHQKGVIHRDLKPSNVLVAHYDDRPVPKVIDFGVAKATGQQLTEQTLHTGFGAVVGTVEYMSPEQATLNQLDVDTRSDVYSLGVLLYELLAGSPPFTKKELEKAGMLEMLRVIREQEPSKPSTKLSTAEGLPTLAANRGTEPAKLTRQVRGELDWIVMRALEKDRNRRYETASSLARDIDHYLRDEPVQACPPSAGYRLRKFWRRNRAPVSAAVVLVLCLIGGITGTTSGLVRAVQAESTAHAQAAAAQDARSAEANQHQIAEKEKLRAEENLKQARAAVDKLYTRVAQDLAGKPHMEQIRRALLADALVFYKGFLAQKSSDPEMRRETALAYSRVGSIQEILGNAPEAESALRQAVAIQEKLVSEFPEVPVYRVDLAMSCGQLSYRLNWVAKNEECTQLRRRALADWEKLATEFPTDSAYQRHMASAHTDLANALKDAMGRPREAEQHFRQALAVLSKVQANFPTEPQDQALVAHCHFWLGVLLLNGSRFAEAEPEIRQALAIYEKRLATTPDNPDAKDKLAHAQAYMGNLLQLTNRDPEAARLYQSAVAIRERLSDDFPDNADHQRRLVLEYEALGRILANLGRIQEAETALRQSVSVGEKLVADHPNVDPFPTSLARSQFQLGLFLYDRNRTEEATDAFRRARQLFEDTVARAPDPRHQNDLAWFLVTCPAVQFRDGERAVAVARRSLQSPPAAWYYWRTLGIAQYRAGKWQDAVEALTKAMELGSGGDSRDWFFLAMVRWQQGDRAQARKWYNQAVEWMEKNLPHDALLRRFRTEAEEVLELKKK